MSMIGNFLAITQQQLDDLIKKPDSIEDFLFADGDSSEAREPLDIDKTWHGIHFLLTGSTWDGSPPWSLVILGGTPIGPELGYGPARYLLPDQVRIVAAALAGLPRTEFMKRYDPEELEQAEIYPSIWADEGDEALDYLLSYYDQLVEYYQTAAKNNHAMLLFLN